MLKQMEDMQMFLLPSDWEKDALRRDFTINAIYARYRSGKIFDPQNGVEI